MKDTVRTNEKWFVAKSLNLMLEKIRRKLKADYIIAGHTHQYHFNNKSRVLNTGSYGYYGNKIIIGDTLILSDVHIGAKDIRKSTIFNFIKEIKKPKYKNIIIIGDFLDLWLHDGKTITRDFKDIFKAINSDKIYVWWVIGNHDNDFKEYPNISKATSNLFIYNDIYTTYINDKKYAFIHGHQYDMTNSTFLIRAFYYIWLQIGDNLYFLGDIFKPLALKIYGWFKRK